MRHIIFLSINIFQNQLNADNSSLLCSNMEKFTLKHFFCFLHKPEFLKGIPLFVYKLKRTQSIKICLSSIWFRTFHNKVKTTGNLLFWNLLFTKNFFVCRIELHLSMGINTHINIYMSFWKRIKQILRNKTKQVQTLKMRLKFRMLNSFISIPATQYTN